MAPMNTVFSLTDYRRKRRRVFFTRRELNQLLSLYSRQVMRGEWRDYAIDQRDGAAFFSVFRHTQESAVFTVVKTASDTRPPAYEVMQGRHHLASGPALGEVLMAIQRTLGPVRLLRDGESSR